MGVAGMGYQRLAQARQRGHKGCSADRSRAYLIACVEQDRTLAAVGQLARARPVLVVHKVAVRPLGPAPPRPRFETKVVQRLVEVELLIGRLVRGDGLPAGRAPVGTGGHGGDGKCNE